MRWAFVRKRAAGGSEQLAGAAGGCVYCSCQYCKVVLLVLVPIVSTAK
jgi:hypothetical protein